MQQSGPEGLSMQAEYFRRISSETLIAKNLSYVHARPKCSLVDICQSWHPGRIGRSRQSNNAKIMRVVPGGLGALQFADFGLCQQVDGELRRFLRQGSQHRKLFSGFGVVGQLGLQIVGPW